MRAQNVFMYPFQSFRVNGVNKGNQRAGSRNLVRGSPSKKLDTGEVGAGGLVHQEVDGGSACHWRTLNQQLLVF